MHTIRLRGPWQYTPLAHTYWTADGQSQESNTDVPPPGRLKLPADWSSELGADFRGKVLFQRTFHCPTGLQENDIVQVQIDSVDALGTVYVNNNTVGELELGQSNLSFEIQQHLEATNLLEILVDLPAIDDASAPLPRPNRAPDQAGGITGEVQLNIIES